MFKKLLMAASLVVTLFAQSAAMAGTWTASATTTIFAAEIFGAATVAIDPGTSDYELSATPGSGAAFNVDYTITGGTWGAALTSGSLTAAGATGAESITLVGGGAVTDSTAKFRVDVTTAYEKAAATGGRVLTLDYTVAGATGMSTAGNGTTIAVALADTLGPLDTSGAATATAASAEAVTFAAAAGTPAQIDVASGSTKFVGASAAAQLTTNLGTFAITETTGTQNLADVSADFVVGTGGQGGVASGTTVTITGDFSASVAVDADESALTADGVTISGCNLTGNRNATTLTATQAQFVLTEAEVAAIGVSGGSNCTVTMNIDGTTILTPFTPAVAFALDYTLASHIDESATGSLGSLTKNGDTAALDLILTPGGAFDGFVRIVNKSAVPGKIIVTLTNDAGTSVVFDLAGDPLAAQASTALISAADLYSQAQAADATFDHNGGKLRAAFDGEFSTIAAQSITISTDNTTFTTF